MFSAQERAPGSIAEQLVEIHGPAAEKIMVRDIAWVAEQLDKLKLPPGTQWSWGSEYYQLGPGDEFDSVAGVIKRASGSVEFIPEG